MRGKLLFITGGLVGYVLGARAGRKRYDQIAAAASELWHAKPVQRRVTEVRDFALEAVGDAPAVLFEAGKKAYATLQGKQAKAKDSAAKNAEASAPHASAARTAAAAKVASSPVSKAPGSKAARPASKPASKTAAKPAAKTAAPAEAAPAEAAPAEAAPDAADETTTK